MFPAALRLLPIKDLKALRVSLSAGDYRHAGPKGPEEICLPNHSRCAIRSGLGPRGCPSPCVWIPSALIRHFLPLRGDTCLTPVGQDRLILPRSGSGEPELQRRSQAQENAPTCRSQISA